MASGRAASEPARKWELRHPAAAYKATIDLPPKYTMRGKTAFGNETTGRTQTEPGGDLSGKLDHILKRTPSWSMTSRGTGIPKPSQQPGPGHYPAPSTLYGSHPTLACAGRVPKTTAVRPDVASKARKDDNPSPQQYQTVSSEGPNHKIGRVDQTTTPKYTMRSKLADPADREVKPGCQEYNLGRATNKGMMNTPAWSMAPRSSGIPKPAGTPGPGKYDIPGSIYGSHPLLTQPGRVTIPTTKRFIYPTPDERPY